MLELFLFITINTFTVLHVRGKDCTLLCIYLPALVTKIKIFTHKIQRVTGDVSAFNTFKI